MRCCEALDNVGTAPNQMAESSRRAGIVPLFGVQVNPRSTVCDVFRGGDNWEPLCLSPLQRAGEYLRRL